LIAQVSFKKYEFDLTIVFNMGLEFFFSRPGEGSPTKYFEFALSSVIKILSVHKYTILEVKNKIKWCF
jgi:hypothetical protein